MGEVITRLVLPLCTMIKQFNILLDEHITNTDQNKRTKQCVRWMRNTIILDMLLKGRSLSKDMFLHHVGGLIANTCLCDTNQFEMSPKLYWVFLESLTVLTAIQKHTNIDMTYPSIACILGFRLPYFFSLYHHIAENGKFVRVMSMLLTMHIFIDFIWLKSYMKRMTFSKHFCGDIAQVVI